MLDHKNGTSQGKTKRIYDITVRMFETIGVEVGPDLSNGKNTI